MSAVTKYLADHRVPHIALDHARTQTALEEASELGVAPGQVAKVILLDTASGHAVAVLPSSRRLDLKRIAHAMGDARVRLATEAEITEHFPDFELGALPPLAGMLQIPIYLDEELASHRSIVFAAGKQMESVMMRTADLLAETSINVAPFCARQDLDEDWMD
jgi:Ala-tRNA(Pro) deacylase